ncbi:MAG: DUF1579 domain-containing protein [Thermodesulfobacteriota bacterium]
MNSLNVSKRYLLPLPFFALVFTAFAAVGKEEDKTSDQNQDAMMAKWKEYATPNENHKLLDSFVGKWNYTVRWWMSPDSKPEESKGTSEVKWIMGGRFLKQSVEGQGMSKDQPFKGIGISGYDNAEKQYKSLWIDNMGTGMMIGSGSYDPSTKTFVDKGTFSCPAQSEKSYRSVTTIINKDKYTYEMYTTDPDGKEFRNMEIAYTRKR